MLTELDKMRQMAGLEVISEEMGSETHQMANKIIQMAEAKKYEQGAAEGGQVTTDSVMDAAQAIIKEIADTVLEKLQADFKANQQEVAAPQVSTSHGMDTGTAPGGDLTSSDGTNQFV